MGKKSKYHDKYLPADKSFVIHRDDPGLVPIEIKLPLPPEDISIIPGYGKDPLDQVFEYTVMPEKLVSIDKTIAEKKKRRNAKDADKISDEDRWAEIYGNPVYYAKEILWIQREEKRCQYGYWFFLKGKPTYINGWCYKTLNYWQVGNAAQNNVKGLPFFNRRLKEWFLSLQYVYTTTEAPFKFKVTYRVGRNIAEPKFFNEESDARDFALTTDGILEEGMFIHDTKRRAFFGVNNPKHRRTLATFGAMSIADSIVSSGPEHYGGVQSKNKDSAERAYVDKFVKPWQGLPFFLRPITDGTDNPKKKMNYQFPSSKKGRRTDLVPLNGWFTPESSNEGAFDGDKLHVVVQDELWKENLADVVQRINIIQPAMATGAGSDIFGLMICISTVGLFDGGGSKFQEFSRLSHWENRDVNGSTPTGMMNLFFPAYYCLENFIDKYGDPVIEDPPSPVVGIDGKLIPMGAKTYIKNKIDEYTRQKAWSKRNKFILDHPSEWKDLFRRSMEDSSYNIDALQERYTSIVSVKTKPYEMYRLDWKDGVFGSTVVATPDPKGKHCISYLPPSDKQNQKQKSDQYNCFFPASKVLSMFYAGCDPVRTNASEVTWGRGSSAAMAIYYAEDTFDISEEKKSDNYVHDYIDRPENKHHAIEEMLKACILFGAMALTENNIPDVADKFKEWGHAGYLLHVRDEKGKLKELAGVNATAMMERIFGDFGVYLSNNVFRCNHPRILKQAIDVGHHKFMTDYDVFTAACYAYHASKAPNLVPRASVVQYEEKDFEWLHESFDQKSWF